MRLTTYIAWILLAAALVAWVGVGFFAWTIAGEESDRVARIDLAETSSMKLNSAIRMRALALDTKAERAQLERFLDVDVVSVANQIEAAGKAAGVTLKLGTVASGRGQVVSGGAAIKTVEFSVDAEGKFSALMRAAEFFEALPVVSSLVRLDIERVPSSGGAPGANSWRMNARIRVFTTSDISS